MKKSIYQENHDAALELRAVCREYVQQLKEFEIQLADVIEKTNKRIVGGN
jgi:hypothetical protein